MSNRNSGLCKRPPYLLRHNCVNLHGMRFSPLRVLPLLTVCLLFCFTAIAQQNTEAAGPDIVIHGGRIIDGTGNPWYAGDIAITDGRIVALGKIPGGIARRVIEAKGQVVAPGFIDMLGQSETALLIDNRSVSKLAQGITSEITGEGGSIAPQNA
ncbi:MAG: hypothetical protein ACXV5J_09705, partial [Candidatus Angelobacter sp.]